MTLKEQIIFHTLQLDGEAVLLRLLTFIKMLQQGAELPVHQPIMSFPQLKIYTVEEVSQPSYQHQNPKKEDIVGAWPSDEPLEQLLQMIGK